MGYSSLSFDPSAMTTEIAAARTAAASATSDAVGASVAAAAALTKADGASTAVAPVIVKAGAASAAASNAVSKAGVATSGASDASSALSKASVLFTSSIKSKPGVGSFAIKEFVYTAASEIKARYSTAAKA